MPLLVHDFCPPETLGECINLHPAKQSHIGYTKCAHTPLTCPTAASVHMRSEPHLPTTFLDSDNPPSSTTHSLRSSSSSHTHFHRPVSGHIYCSIYVFLNHLTWAKRCYLFFFYCVTDHMFEFCALNPLLP